MVDQDAAYFIIEPLFLLTPILTLGVIQLIHYFQTPLVWVVSQSILQQRLVIVEPLDGELSWVIVFLEESGGEVTWFV